VSETQHPNIERIMVVSAKFVAPSAWVNGSHLPTPLQRLVEMSGVPREHALKAYGLLGKLVRQGKPAQA